MTDYTDEIKARLAAATPGPWEHYHSGVLRHGVDSDHGLICFTSKPEGEENCEDLVFIAHAPTDIANLLEEREVLREALNKIATDKQHFDFREKWKLSMTEMSIIESFQKEAREALEWKSKK